MAIRIHVGMQKALWKHGSGRPGWVIFAKDELKGVFPARTRQIASANACSNFDCVAHPPSHGVLSGPGMTHSHTRRFTAPSCPCAGLATKPQGWSFFQIFLSCASRESATLMPLLLCTTHATQIWRVWSTDRHRRRVVSPCYEVRGGRSPVLI